MIKEICRNLDTAAKSVENIDYTVVLRGDSTLRGHFPEARMTCFSSVIVVVNDVETCASIWKMTQLLFTGSGCCCFSIGGNGCMDNLSLFPSRRPLHY